MFGVTTSDDYQPVTWVGRHPVHVTTLLVAVHVFAAIVACFLGGAGILGHLAFDSALVWQRGEFWQLATYAFVHSPSALLWFAVEMYMLFVFGREVERFIGRRAFIVLYLFLLLAPTLLLSLWGLGQRTGIAGSPALHFGIFIAFATIYPNVELLLRIQAKWVALALAAISTLQLLAYRDWSEWPCCGSASSSHFSSSECAELVPSWPGGAISNRAGNRNRSFKLCRDQLRAGWWSLRMCMIPSTRCWIKFRSTESTA